LTLFLGEYNKLARDDMKRLMGEQQAKSPINQARNVKLNVPQVSPFANLLGSKDQYRPLEDSHS
jgi:hypothetical protein